MSAASVNGSSGARLWSPSLSLRRRGEDEAVSFHEVDDAARVLLDEFASSIKYVEELYARICFSRTFYEIFRMTL
jgi:hypothetical protein